VRELTDQLCEQARRAGIEIYSSRRDEEWSGIVSLIVPGVEPRAVVRRCREQGMVINQRAGRVRVSPHCYNTPEEIDQLVRLLVV
jgi:selenocysteine lyase/cysteine desulfurase